MPSIKEKLREMDNRITTRKLLIGIQERKEAVGKKSYIRRKQMKRSILMKI